MLLKVLYVQDDKGGFTAVTRYDGHIKVWYAPTLVQVKQKAGSFLGRAHRAGLMDGIAQLKFFEGIPNDNTVWLLDEPERRTYRRRLPSFQKELVKKDESPKAEQPVESQVQEDTEFFYKEEDGYLKVYRKQLCQSFKVSSFN